MMNVRLEVALTRKRFETAKRLHEENRKKFEKAFSEHAKTLSTIRTADKARLLLGIGTEYLMINGEVIAVFLNGNMKCIESKETTDPIWSQETRTSIRIRRTYD